MEKCHTEYRRCESTGEKRRGVEKCHDAMIERCIAINSHWPVSSVAVNERVPFLGGGANTGRLKTWRSATEYRRCEYEQLN